MRAAVDIMGGDRAPAEILRGCFEYAPHLGERDAVLLVGDDALLRDALAGAGATYGLTPEQTNRFSVVASTQIVTMDESPVEAVRKKPDSSIAVMTKLVADARADVAISAGNTGACVAAAQLRLRTLPGVSRPGIGVVLPTPAGQVVLCDAGANVSAKPHHLLEYAVMASAYAEATAGLSRPRVGLLSVGEEDAKGTDLIKAAGKLLRETLPGVSELDYVGHVEGKDLFGGGVDVVVCDGFVGNVVLKVAEGMAEGLFRIMGGTLKDKAPHLLGEIGPLLKGVQAKHDWQETGGAPLLGVGGHVLICHGRSEARAIRNALRVGARMVTADLNRVISRRLASLSGTYTPEA